MREIRLSGSEGGGSGTNHSFLPLSLVARTIRPCGHSLRADASHRGDSAERFPRPYGAVPFNYLYRRLRSRCGGTLPPANLLGPFGTVVNDVCSHTRAGGPPAPLVRFLRGPQSQIGDLKSQMASH
jgi:hypothetical protein